MKKDSIGNAIYKIEMRKRNKRNIKKFYKILYKTNIKEYKIIYSKINKDRNLNSEFII